MVWHEMPQMLTQHAIARLQRLTDREMIAPKEFLAVKFTTALEKSSDFAEKSTPSAAHAAVQWTSIGYDFGKLIAQRFQQPMRRI